MIFKPTITTHRKEDIMKSYDDKVQKMFESYSDEQVQKIFTQSGQEIDQFLSKAQSLLDELQNEKNIKELKTMNLTPKGIVATLSNKFMECAEAHAANFMAYHELVVNRGFDQQESDVMDILVRGCEYHRISYTAMIMTGECGQKHLNETMNVYRDVPFLGGTIGDHMNDRGILNPTV